MVAKLNGRLRIEKEKKRKEKKGIPFHLLNRIDNDRETNPNAQYNSYARQ